jgi:hypothetical protein
MASQSSRDELRSELRRQGLPRAYITRLLAELDDHYEDLLEERSTSMGAARKLQLEQDDLHERLGEPAQLALFAAEQYHARSFWGRHPLVTFLVAPLPLLMATWVTYCLAVWMITYCVYCIGSWTTNWNVESYDHPFLQAILLACFSWGVVVLSPVATGLMLCRAYRRNALPVCWPVLGCALLAVVAAMFQLSWRLSSGPLETERGLLMIGLNVAASFQWFALTFLPKFALAMGIGLLLVKRAQRQLEIQA